MSDTFQAQKLYLPGLAGLWDALSPYGYVIIRFAAGAIIIYHGWAKLFFGFAPFVAKNIVEPMGFPAPLAWAYFLGILELFGGALVAIGLWTRPIAFMFVIEMVIITFGYLFPHGYFFTNKGGGYEFTLLWLAVYLGILFRGSDRCSVDRLIGKEF